MDEEGGAAVDLYILLKGSLLGDIFVAGLEPSIQHSEGLPHAVVHEELDDGPGDIESHGSNQSVSNISVPKGGEVGESSTEHGAEPTSLVNEVGIDEQQQQGGVEELH